MLVHSQLVCLLPVGICNHVMFIWIIWKYWRSNTRIHYKRGKKCSLVKVTADIIRKKSLTPPTPPPEELVGMFFSWTDPTNSQSFAVLPYIKGITEPLSRILKSHDIRVTNKPIKTLQQEFPVPKFRPRIDNQCNVVYKIPCGSCPWSYIGETKRSFSTRQKEHIRNTKQCAKGSIM